MHKRKRADRYLKLIFILLDIMYCNMGTPGYCTLITTMRNKYDAFLFICYNKNIFLLIHYFLRFFFIELQTANIRKH